MPLPKRCTWPLSYLRILIVSVHSSSSSSRCSGKPALFYCGTPSAFHITIKNVILVGTKGEDSTETEITSNRENHNRSTALDQLLLGVTKKIGHLIVMTIFFSFMWLFLFISILPD